MRWEEVNKNLSSRVDDSIKAKINNTNKNIKENVHLITSSSDTGVIRNGGRNGSLYGPRAIMATLSKMANTNTNKNIFHSETVTNEDENFDRFQVEQTELIKNLLNKGDSTIHIGSGHDGIYPFIKAIAATNSKIGVINIDAHLDTRKDQVHHSGTPFRQLADELGEKLELIQIGIHDFANASSNYQDIKMNIVTMKELKSQTQNMNQNKSFIENLFSSFSENAVIIISIDIDAIDGSEMKAVSAVNHDGITLAFLRELLSRYKEIYPKHYLGLYEYNPLFDDLGTTGARAICSLIHQFFYSN
ncbi:arginase family protein [Bacteriovorax sp. Seq25_V]|uniref:arginase family protein n=1 Tax=Bacteriovorax sp. Seq25_V TaxID=1201288 RepID=UPI00038A0A46|nr:arginase family protein [Bacteriovorax sp. Seq25_V]EQC43760.1 arginase family protein [Bacteriovorax sp. Seq25_V]